MRRRLRWAAYLGQNKKKCFTDSVSRPHSQKVSGYDGLFILPHCYATHRDVTDPITVGTKVLSLKSYRLTFKDSLCFLPFPLANRFWRKKLVPINTTASELPGGWYGAWSNQSTKAPKWLAWREHLHLQHPSSGDHIHIIRNGVKCS